MPYSKLTTAGGDTTFLPSSGFVMFWASYSVVTTTIYNWRYRTGR